MASTHLHFDDAARQALLRGVEKLSSTVRPALGPSEIVAKDSTSPTISAHDVLAATDSEGEDAYERIGAQLVRDVARKTTDLAGDGAATAMLLAESIYSQCLKSVTAGANPVSLQRGIDKAVDAISTELARISTSVTDRTEIMQVATMSASGETSVGEIIADAVDKVGKDGPIVIVEEPASLETSVELVKGMQFPAGYLSPYFATNSDAMEVSLANAYVLIYEGTISKINDLVPVLEKVAATDRSLLIIAANVQGEALATLVVNVLRRTIQVAAVRAPEFAARRHTFFEDMALFTGGKLVTEELEIKLESLALEDLGNAKHVIIDSESTTILEGAGKSSNVRDRAEEIRRRIEESTSDYDRDKLAERLARLVGGVAVISVGAATPAEAAEKKARISDALKATRAAMDEGIVPGGGVAFIRAQKALDDLVLEGGEEIGLSIVKRAVEEPLRQLADNWGQDGTVVIQEVRKRRSNDGYDVIAGDYVDLVHAGVIDTTIVTRSALQNAAAMSAVLLEREVDVTDLLGTMTTLWRAKDGNSVEVKLDGVARTSLIRGGENVAREMQSVSGPTERFVKIHKSFGKPSITRDMVTVAGDPYERMASDVVQEIATRGGVPAGGGEPPPSSSSPATRLTPEPPDPKLPPKRYLEARAGDHLKVGVPFLLTARISTEQSPSGPGQGSAEVTGEVTGKLKISIYAPGFISHNGTQQEIHVPATGNSRWAPFDLEAMKAGIQQIEVLAWKNSAQVGGVTISIGVDVAQPDAGSAEGPLDMREPEDGEYTLEVTLESNPSRYRFQLRSNTGDNWPPVYSEPLDGANHAAYASTLLSLNTQARNANQLSPYAQGEWLEGMGGILFKSLIPPDLKDALWENRDKIKYLNILSASEPLPWELLNVSDHRGAGGRFLADTATVSRWRYGPRPGRNMSRHSPYFVLPTGSPTKAQAEVTYVRNKVGSGTTIEQLDDLLRLLNDGQFSLLHFASHNVVNPIATAGLYIPFGSSRFDITFMGKWSNDQFRSQSPLVFMNSCTSGGAAPLYTEMAGWAGGFIKAGCGAFIGALWEIRDTSALTFAEKFYDEVTAGKNLGESMREARSALKTSDPTYLAYTLYGNPLATFA